MFSETTRRRTREDRIPGLVDESLFSSRSLVFHLSLSVINFFSLPIDDECLSDDGRRVGMCMNVYECRIQGIMKHQKAFRKATNELLDFMCSFPVKVAHRGVPARWGSARVVSVSSDAFLPFLRVLSYFPFSS